MPTTITWEHTDPVLLPVSDGAMFRAIAEMWPAPGTRIDTQEMFDACRSLRALVLRVLAACWALSEAPPPPPDSTSARFPDFSAVGYRSAQHKAVAAHLLGALVLLSGTKGVMPLDLGIAPNVKTSKGMPIADQTEGDVGNPYLIGLAIVAGAAAWTAGVAVIAQKTSEVVDRDLAREADGRQMTKFLAEATKVVEDHRRREDKAGKALALTAAERELLAMLRESMGKVAAKQETPLPSPIPSGKDIGKGVGIGLVAVIVAGVALIAIST